MSATDLRLGDAHAIGMRDLVDRLGIAGLHPSGEELVGPCPQCGGTDRFAINPRLGVFLCRRCDARGDQVSLVQHVLGMEFKAALDWLCGPAQGLTEVQAAERRRQAAANRAAQAQAAQRARAAAMSLAARLWRQALSPAGSPVVDYLALRGLGPDRLPHLPRCLRFMPDCRLTTRKDRAASDRQEWRTLHVGPAMLAAVQGPDGRLIGVHRTWIDLDQPKGKAVVIDLATGEAVPSKKMLGSKKGGAIRLSSPSGATTLVMGEGIETTLTALIAEDQPFRRQAYWAGVDLGNMAGRMVRGPGQSHAGIPDLADLDAFVPPPGLARLVFIMDGDSNPKLTRAKLQAGLRRAMRLRPGLAGSIVYPGEGRDLNDLLLEHDNA